MYCHFLETWWFLLLIIMWSKLMSNVFPLNRIKVRDLQFVKDYQPFKKDVQLRCLLYGPSGAGKSSFINSVDSVLRGKITRRAAVDALSHGSFTTKVRIPESTKDTTTIKKHRTYFSLAQWLELSHVLRLSPCWCKFESGLWSVNTSSFYLPPTKRLILK